MGVHVVVLAGGGVAERAAAGGVPPGEEATERRREGPTLGLHRDELAARGMRVQTSQHRAHRGTVGPEGISDGVVDGGRCGRREAGAQLLADRLGRDGPVAGDAGGVTGVRQQQGAVGDDDADVELDLLHRALASQHGVHEGVGHDRHVAVRGAVGATTLRLEGEALVHEVRVDRGQQGGEPGHAVRPRGERDGSGATGPAVAQGRALRVEARDDPVGLVRPVPQPGTVEVGQALAEDGVHLAALRGGDRRGRGRERGGDLGGEEVAGERGADLRHLLDEPVGHGEGAPGVRGGAAGDQREVAARDRGGAVVERGG